MGDQRGIWSNISWWSLFKVLNRECDSQLPQVLNKRCGNLYEQDGWVPLIESCYNRQLVSSCGTTFQRETSVGQLVTVGLSELCLWHSHLLRIGQSVCNCRLSTYYSACVLSGLRPCLQYEGSSLPVENYTKRSVGGKQIIVALSNGMYILCHSKWY